MDPPKHGRKGVKLLLPQKFDGKKENLEEFLIQCALYLRANKEEYINDDQRITFYLSFMQEGEAQNWKRQFTQSKEIDVHPENELGTLAEFLTKLKKDFQQYDAPGEALEDMEHIKQGSLTAEEHVSRFKDLVSRADLPKEAKPVLVKFFRNSLNLSLQKRLLTLD